MVADFEEEVDEEEERTEDEPGEPLSLVVSKVDMTSWPPQNSFTLPVLSVSWLPIAQTFARSATSPSRSRHASPVGKSVAAAAVGAKHDASDPITTGFAISLAFVDGLIVQSKGSASQRCLITSAATRPRWIWV